MVVYHVWFGRVSGGVDVFLMISAFFLTHSFAQRMRRGEPLQPWSFWVRKFRRLLPAAAVTIFGVLVVTGHTVPAVDWPAIWRQAWASLGYVQNWELAFRSIDYYARETVLPSPLQHFWSLSVQGQVFVLWPLLFLLAALIVRRARVSVTSVLLVMFGAVFVCSLVFSISETATNQQFAYFDTRTRLWEFALGSLVAVVLPFFRAPAVLRALVQGSAQRLDPLTACLPTQASLPGWQLRVLDGNHLPASDKRLASLRGFRGAARPGHTLVLYDPDSTLVCDIVACEDAHQSERVGAATLIESALAQQGWIADRHFCTEALLRGLSQRQARPGQASFIVREQTRTQTTGTQGVCGRRPCSVACGYRSGYQGWAGNILKG